MHYRYIVNKKASTRSVDAFGAGQGALSLGTVSGNFARAIRDLPYALAIFPHPGQVRVRTESRFCVSAKVAQRFLSFEGGELICFLLAR